MAETIGRRLRMSNLQIARIAFLVDQHLRHCSAPEMRRATLKRFLRQDGIDELLELTRIDALGSNRDLSKYQYFREKLEELSTDADELRPAPLISGHDLITMGLEPGPRFREILAEVEEAQLDGRLRTQDEALAWVREQFATRR
jgi:poly(A) polymerase